MAKRYLDADKLRKELFKRTEGYALSVRKLYLDALDKVIKIVGGTELEPGVPFSFSEYGYGDQVTPVFRELYSKVYQTIKSGVVTEWNLSNDNTDALIKAVFGKKAVEDGHFARLFARNKEALDAFFARKAGQGGLNLSQRVWKYTGMYKSELEDVLELAIGEGTPAMQLAAKVKQYLQDPDKFYRRFRVKVGEDEEGNPIYGRKWKRRIFDQETGQYRWVDDDPRKYHPGQGVYRSSARNAQRLARTETNIAYRTAEYDRWQQLPFVIGIEIKVSNNHPHVDICDDLAGFYPKPFKFTGWHSNCRCYQVPVLASEQEVDRMTERILGGEDPSQIRCAGEIREMPDAFKEWAKENEERMEAARQRGTLPYFIRDNERLVDIAINGTPQQTAKQVAAARHAARTPEQIQAIHDAWDFRKEAIKMSEDVIGKLDGISDIDLTEIQEKLNSAHYKEAREIAQRLQAYVDDLTHLTYVDNGLAMAKKFSYAEIKGCDDSIGVTLQKLAEKGGYGSWADCPLEYQQKKLHFQVFDYYGSDKYGAQSKFATWQVAENAYAKQLGIVNEKLYWKQAKQSSAELLAFKTKSKPYNDLLAKLTDALDSQDKVAYESALNEAMAKKAELEKAAAKRSAKKNAAANNVQEDFRFDASDLTAERKDAAYWGKTVEDADSRFRGKCGDLWQTAVEGEKEAAHRYTAGSCYLNEPLRGESYTGGKHTGLFNKDCENLTNMISRSTYDFDYWCQRGDWFGLFEKRFGFDLRDPALRADPSRMLGKEGVEKAFLSCGDSKGAGFGGDLTLNIYCPKGTQGLYCEPFSYYGHDVNGKGMMNCSDGLKWDGVSRQRGFGSEAEILLQRGTKFRIIKVEWSEQQQRWFIDIEVVGIETRPI